MIHPRQIRAARALAGLSQEDLATKAGIGIATLRRIEGSDDIAGTAQTLARIERALDMAGVMLIEQDAKTGPGVRLRKRLPRP